MQSVRIDKPIEWPTSNVYILADLHIGDPHCDMAFVDAQLKRIREDPYGVVVCNGDLLNTALKTSVSDVYGEILKPVDQISKLIDLLEPIRDRIIGMTTGNHEWRVYRNDGIDIMRIVSRQLGLEDRYNPEGILIFYRFGKGNMHTRHPSNTRQLFVIYATHGSGGGRKEGAKAIRLADMASIVDADIMIHSHTHLPMIMRESYYRVNIAQSCAVRVDRLFVNCGASLDYGGYGQSQEFKPNSKHNPVIHLDPYKARATATL